MIVAGAIYLAACHCLMTSTYMNRFYDTRP